MSLKVNLTWFIAEDSKSGKFSHEITIHKQNFELKYKLLKVIINYILLSV